MNRMPGVEGQRLHALDRETSRFAGLTRRLGRRLSYALKRFEDAQAIPDSDWSETYRLYSASMLGLLREQRERGKLAMLSGAPVLSEAEHAEALEAFRRDTVLNMSDEDMEKLAAERKALKAGQP